MAGAALRSWTARRSSKYFALIGNGSFNVKIASAFLALIGTAGILGGSALAQAPATSASAATLKSVSRTTKAVNYRRAGAYEEVKVTPSALTVRKVSHHRAAREWVLNPLWVRLDQKTHAEFGIEKLYLVSKGRRISIASFLGPDEKASFAKALTEALQAARRGPTYNPV